MTPGASYLTRAIRKRCRTLNEIGTTSRNHTTATTVATVSAPHHHRATASPEKSEPTASWWAKLSATAR